MLYTVKNIQDLDFSRYKRLFAFGCSFTQYHWPTWADLISEEMPNAKFINFGQSGAGQIYITSMLNQAKYFYKFNKDDLIVIMWSTFLRLDTYCHNAWTTPGNLTTQDVYHSDLLKKLDLTGCAIRDLALIDVTMNLLPHEEFDSFACWSLHPEDQVDISCNSSTRLADTVYYYQHLNKIIVSDLFTHGAEREWPQLIVKSDGVFDYHPSTRQYANYLENVGIKLTEKTRQYAIDCEKYALDNTSVFELHPQPVRIL